VVLTVDKFVKFFQMLINQPYNETLESGNSQSMTNDELVSTSPFSYGLPRTGKAQMDSLSSCLVAP
jgi:hypothetical protein